MGYRVTETRWHNIEGVPAEEGMSEADAIARVDLDPEKQRNFTEDESVRDARTDAEPERDLDAPEYDEA